jgi:hypothetical protein
MLSSRGTKNVGLFDIPWRYSKLQTYDKETNPDGLISFALAENVCIYLHPTGYIHNLQLIGELHLTLS